MAGRHCFPGGTGPQTRVGQRPGAEHRRHGHVQSGARTRCHLRGACAQQILEPFLRGAQAEGIRFHGLLFPGLMLTADGAKVLEFNCRFGDPETQVLLPRLKSDLLDLLEAAIDGTLDRCTPQWDERASVCVVMASGGYPGAYQGGKEVTGLEQFDGAGDVMVFHAGTKVVDGKLVTAGGASSA